MTFRRYFGIITTWYLHSHRTWDRLCHSCIGSSFLPRGAFPEVGAYSFDGGMHAGSLEALRVTRPEAVGLERTKSEAAECVANVDLELLTNFHVAGTLLDFPSAPRLARG